MKATIDDVYIDGSSHEPLQPFDNNQDGVIGNFELLYAIDCWADLNCDLAPEECNRNFYLLNLIDLWAAVGYKYDETGEPCFPWIPAE